MNPAAPFITRAASIELRARAPAPAPGYSTAALSFLGQFLALDIDPQAFQVSPLDALKRAAGAAGRPSGLGMIAAMPEWDRLIQTSVRIVALSKDFTKLPKPLRQGAIIVARPLRTSAKSKAAPLLVAECEIAGVGLHGVKAQSFAEALGETGRIVWIGD